MLLQSCTGQTFAAQAYELSFPACWRFVSRQALGHHSLL